MLKTLKFFQYIYLALALFCVWEAIQNWTIDRQRSYILLFFAALAVFLFFFRKHFRKKFEQRNKQ